jgi:hypothetical protein
MTTSELEFTGTIPIAMGFSKSKGYTVDDAIKYREAMDEMFMMVNALEAKVPDSGYTQKTEIIFPYYDSRKFKVIVRARPFPPPQEDKADETHRPPEVAGLESVYPIGTVVKERGGSRRQGTVIGYRLSRFNSHELFLLVERYGTQTSFMMKPEDGLIQLEFKGKDF